MMMKKTRRPLFGLGLILLTAAALVGCAYDGNVPEYIVETIAGTPGVAGNADGKGVGNATFNYPEDIAVFGDTMYVADTSNNRIRKIDLTPGDTYGRVTHFAGAADGRAPTYHTPAEEGDDAALPVAGGSLVASVARFERPRRLAISSNGTKLYVADHGQSVIRQLDLEDDGKVYTLTKLLDNFYPVDLAVDKRGGNPVHGRHLPEPDIQSGYRGRPYWDGGSLRRLR